MLNSKPLRCTSTVADHASFQFSRFVSTYYTLGAREVHLIYDKACKQPFGPKSIERSEKETTAKKTNNMNACLSHQQQDYL